jgi:hypothetical protein
MKTPALVLLTIAGFLSCPPAMAGEAEDIGAIRALYAKIDKGQPTKTETIEFEVPDSPVSGTITRRSYEGGLSAIKLSYSEGDHGSTDQSYYFDEKGLFFIFVRDSSWRFAPDTTDEKPSTIDTLTETRYYVRKGSLIQILKRSATSGDAAKLPALIAKAENAETKPTDEDTYLLKRADALQKVRTSEEAVKFFVAED